MLTKYRPLLPDAALSDATDRLPHTGSLVPRVLLRRLEMSTSRPEQRQDSMPIESTVPAVKDERDTEDGDDEETLLDAVQASRCAVVISSGERGSLRRETCCLAPITVDTNNRDDADGFVAYRLLPSVVKDHNDNADINTSSHTTTSTVSTVYDNNSEFDVRNPPDSVSPADTRLRNIVIVLKKEVSPNCRGRKPRGGRKRRRQLLSSDGSESYVKVRRDEDRSSLERKRDELDVEIDEGCGEDGLLHAGAGRIKRKEEDVLKRKTRATDDEECKRKKMLKKDAGLKEITDVEESEKGRQRKTGAKDEDNFGKGVPIGSLKMTTEGKLEDEGTKKDEDEKIVSRDVKCGQEGGSLLRKSEDINIESRLGGKSLRDNDRVSLGRETNTDKNISLTREGGDEPLLRDEDEENLLQESLVGDNHKTEGKDKTLFRDAEQHSKDEETNKNLDDMEAVPRCRGQTRNLSQRAHDQEDLSCPQEPTNEPRQKELPNDDPDEQDEHSNNTHTSQRGRCSGQRSQSKSLDKILIVKSPARRFRVVRVGGKGRGDKGQKIAGEDGETDEDGDEKPPEILPPKRRRPQHSSRDAFMNETSAERSRREFPRHNRLATNRGENKSINEGDETEAGGDEPGERTDKLVEKVIKECEKDGKGLCGEETAKGDHFDGEEETTGEDAAEAGSETRNTEATNDDTEEEILEGNEIEENKVEIKDEDQEIETEDIAQRKETALNGFRTLSAVEEIEKENEENDEGRTQNDEQKIKNNKEDIENDSEKIKTDKNKINTGEVEIIENVEKDDTKNERNDKKVEQDEKNIKDDKSIEKDDKKLERDDGKIEKCETRIEKDDKIIENDYKNVEKDAKNKKEDANIERDYMENEKDNENIGKEDKKIENDDNNVEKDDKIKNDDKKIEKDDENNEKGDQYNIEKDEKNKKDNGKCDKNLEKDVEKINKDSENIEKDIEIINKDNENIEKNVEIMNKDDENIEKNVELMNKDYEKLPKDVDKINKDGNKHKKDAEKLKTNLEQLIFSNRQDVETEETNKLRETEIKETIGNKMDNNDRTFPSFERTMTNNGIFRAFEPTSENKKYEDETSLKAKGNEIRKRLGQDESSVREMFRPSKRPAASHDGHKATPTFPAWTLPSTYASYPFYANYETPPRLPPPQPSLALPTTTSDSIFCLPTKQPMLVHNYPAPAPTQDIAPPRIHKRSPPPAHSQRPFESSGQITNRAQWDDIYKQFTIPANRMAGSRRSASAGGRSGNAGGFGETGSTGGFGSAGGYESVNRGHPLSSSTANTVSTSGQISITNNTASTNIGINNNSSTKWYTTPRLQSTQSVQQKPPQNATQVSSMIDLASGDALRVQQAIARRALSRKEGERVDPLSMGVYPGGHSLVAPSAVGATITSNTEPLIYSSRLPRTGATITNTPTRLFATGPTNDNGVLNLTSKAGLTAQTTGIANAHHFIQGLQRHLDTRPVSSTTWDPSIPSRAGLPLDLSRPIRTSSRSQQQHDSAVDYSRRGDLAAGTTTANASVMPLFLSQYMYPMLNQKPKTKR